MISFILLIIMYGLFGVALLNGIRFQDIFKISGYKGIPKSIISGSLFLGLSFALILVGSIRKMNFSPPPDYFLAIGMILLISLLISNSFLYGSKKIIDMRKQIIRISTIRIFGSVVILIQILIPLESMIDIFSNNFPPRIIELQKRLLKNPDNIQLQNMLRKEFELFNEASDSLAINLKKNQPAERN